MAYEKYGKPPCYFKSDIPFEDYYLLAETHFCEEERRQITYMYFDTHHNPELCELFNKRIRLRVRIKNRDYSLEMKSRMPGRSFEIADKLSLKEFQCLLQGVFPEGKIKDVLLEMQSSLQIIWLHTSVTVRQKCHFMDGILVIDQTSFNRQTFYQIEFRSYNDVDKNKLKYLQKELRIKKSKERKSKLQKCFDSII